MALLISSVESPSMEVMILEFRRIPTELHCEIQVVVPGRSSGDFHINCEAASRLGAGATYFSMRSVLRY